MKLSNIFNIKTNTGGGNKLFARIMNKYNVPKKEYVKVKDKLENFSGGGDSGSSGVEYYATDLERLQLFGENVLILLMSFSLFKYKFKPLGESIETYIDGGWKFYNYMGYNGNIWLHGIAFSKVKSHYKENNTLKDAVIYYGLDISLFDSVFTPITKEEFYDLNNI